MANRELLDYIASGLRSGYSPQQLRQALLNAGWLPEQVDEALRQAAPLPAPNVQSASPVRPQASMGIFQKFKTVLIHPNEFFERVKGEGYGSPFKFYLFILLINAAVSSVLILSGLVPISGLESLNMIPGMGTLFAGIFAMMAIILIPIVLVLLIAAIFLTAAILHVFAYLYGARKGFVSTCKALLYSSATGIFSVPLLFNIPWVSFITGVIIFVWAFILLAKGLSKLHEISGVRALLAVLTPILVILAIIFVLALSAFIMLMSYFSGLGGATPVPLY
jgi:hypothetical protein